MKTTANDIVPNPGSDEAIDAGCTCAVLDNNHGNSQTGNFWIADGCPLHDIKTSENREKKDIKSFYLVAVFKVITFFWYISWYVLSFNSDTGHQMYVRFCKRVANKWPEIK